MSLLFTNDGAEGPYGSPVLDGFGAADATPPPINWSAGSGYVDGAGDGLVTIAGTLTRRSAGAYRQGAHYSRGGTYGGGTQAVEAWVEFAAVASGQEFAIKLMITSPTDATGNDYGFYIDWSGGGANPVFTVNRRNAGSFTSVVASVTSVSLAAGDSVGITLEPNGANLDCEIWKKSPGGSWTSIGTGTDTSPLSTAGYFAIQGAGGQGFKSRVFGGGNVTPPSTGDDWEEFPADSVTMSDAISVAIGKGIADTVGLADALSFEFSKAVADSVGLADAIALGREIVFGDTVGLSDLATPERGIIVGVDDSVTMSDTLQKFDYEKLIAESALSIADAIRFDRENAIGDTVGLSDAASIGIGKVIAEAALSLSDFITVETGKGVSPSDTVGLADAIAFDLGKAVADVVGLSDAISFTFGLTKPVADSVTMSDAVTLDRGMDRQLADTVGLADAIALGFGKVVADVVTLADALWFAREITLADTVSLADNVTPEKFTGGDSEITVNDSVSIIDSVARQLNGQFLGGDAGSAVRKWFLSRPGWY
jgi:hypothetical protein